MDILKAIILGIVEGLTEFLPISSTGHLILVGHWLGTDAGAQREFAEAFDVVIQLGAVIAVMVYFRALLTKHIVGLFRREPASISLAVALAIAFVPAAIVGFALHHMVEKYLFGPVPVALALILGGILMIVVERMRRTREVVGLDGLEHVTPRRALAIGIGQCFALLPGTSRSMSTIVAGQLTGLSTATATEFSFLLAIPTLAAATLFKLIKSRHVLMASHNGSTALAVGLIVSFIVALVVVAAFLRYLRTWGLSPFGFYRIALGILVFVALVRA